MNHAVHQAARVRMNENLPDLPEDVLRSIRTSLPVANGLRMNVAQRKFTSSRLASTTKFQSRLVAGLNLLRSHTPPTATMVIQSSPVYGQDSRVHVYYDYTIQKYRLTSDTWDWTTPMAAEAVIRYLLPLVEQVNKFGGSLTIELPVGHLPFKYAWPGFELQGDARLLI